MTQFQHSNKDPNTDKIVCMLLLLRVNPMVSPLERKTMKKQN